MKTILKDKTGKISMKRIAGGIGVLVALSMAIFPFFITSEYKPTDTMVLGILTASLTAISVGVFEKLN